MHQYKPPVYIYIAYLYVCSTSDQVTTCNVPLLQTEKQTDGQLYTNHAVHIDNDDVIVGPSYG